LLDPRFVVEVVESILMGFWWSWRAAAPAASKERQRKPLWNVLGDCYELWWMIDFDWLVDVN
jgi:hypothetical protein